MKKKIFTLVLCFGLLVGMYAAALAQELDESPTHESERDLTVELLEVKARISDYYDNIENSPRYGGIYYDNDTLVVNYVGAPPTLPRSIEVRDALNIVYHEVAYPLFELEALKDFFGQYIEQYPIATLDANEVTNQVDICLSSYSEDIISELKGLVDETYVENNVLNFIDYSNYSIKSTVGTEPPDSLSF